MFRCACVHVWQLWSWRYILFIFYCAHMACEFFGSFNRLICAGTAIAIATAALRWWLVISVSAPLSSLPRTWLLCERCAYGGRNMAFITANVTIAGREIYVRGRYAFRPHHTTQAHMFIFVDFYRRLLIRTVYGISMCYPFHSYRCQLPLDNPISNEHATHASIHIYATYK